MYPAPREPFVLGFRGGFVMVRPMGHDHSHGKEPQGCCGHSHNHDFDGTDPVYRRRLWLVIAINAVMFVAEMVAGEIAGSQALKADALDFLADTLTYGISLAVIGMSLKVRSTAALAKGVSLAGMGLWVLASTIYQVFVLNVPAAPVMAGVAVAALVANGISVLLLASYKDGDANVRSVWLCSRNDMIGNVIVVAAALGVWSSDTAWPDLIVAAIMAGLFFNSAIKILRQSADELRRAQ